MKSIPLVLMSLWCMQLQAQKSPKVSNPEMQEMLQGLLSHSVPTIDVAQLKAWGTGTVLLLDARETEEYAVSHLPGAIHLGYNRFNMTQMAAVPKDTRIVVYCSVGYRSEKICEQLISHGYSKVYNLYGSIFEWVNQGNKVFDAEGKETSRVHTYNQKWSKWLQKGEKVYN